MLEDQDDWCLDWSDAEEKSGPEWQEPTVTQMVEAYKSLEAGVIPTLKWKNLGYRPPPLKGAEGEAGRGSPRTKEEEKSDFDFMDDFGDNVPVLKRGGSMGNLKGSAKKRTTNLDDVLNKMKKQLKKQHIAE